VLKESGRIEWIDMAKGIGMLLVIVGHYYYTPQPVVDFIYLFHMPLFFFLSGILFNKDISFRTFLKKKGRTLVIPYMFFRTFALVFDVCYALVRGNNVISIIHDSLRNTFVLDPNDTTWFLIALFFIQLIVWLLSKYMKNRMLIAVVCLVSSFFQYMYGFSFPCQLTKVFKYMVFFYAGCLIGNKVLFRTNYKKIMVVIGSCVGCVCTFLLQFKVTDTCVLWATGFLGGVAGILLVISVSHLITCSCIRYVGKNSLIYLGFHNRIMSYFIWDLLYIMHWNGNLSRGLGLVSYSIITMVLLFGILYAIIRLMNHKPWSYFVGKN